MPTPRRSPTDAERLENSAVRWLWHYPTEEEAIARVRAIHQWASGQQIDVAFGQARLAIKRARDIQAQIDILRRRTSG